MHMHTHIHIHMCMCQADVLLVWLIGGAGTVQGVTAIARDPSYPACVPFALVRVVRAARAARAALSFSV